jgi:hypothetical protein
MILHVILTAGKDPALASTTNTAGAISGLLYVVFFGFSQVKSTVAIISTTYYVTLTAIPFFVGFICVSYWLGGEKIVRQQEMIKEKHRQIYGD